MKPLNQNNYSFSHLTVLPTKIRCNFDLFNIWQIHVTTLECAQIDIRIIANNMHTNSVASQTQINIVFFDVKNILVSKFKLKKYCLNTSELLFLSLIENLKVDKENLKSNSLHWAAIFQDLLSICSSSHAVPKALKSLFTPDILFTDRNYKGNTNISLTSGDEILATNFPPKRLPKFHRMRASLINTIHIK